MNLADGLTFIELCGDAGVDPQAEDALRQWMGEAKQELGRHIESQQSPDGTPYVPLAPSTVRRKGHDTALLVNGDLIASVVGNGSGHVEEAIGNYAVLGTSHEKNGKPIALFQQEGTKRNGKRHIPPRPFVGATEDMADNAADLIADSIMASIDAL